jgi:hypothetical protein
MQPFGRSLLLTATWVAAGVIASAAQAADSPTGRNPRVLWSPERQDTWNRLVSEDHPWWRYIEARADEVLDDDGQGLWNTLAYQMTGDPSRAARAWARIRDTGLIVHNHDYVREFLIDFAWMYDWLYPYLSANGLLDDYDAKLDTFVDFVLNDRGLRTTDSDECLGYYFGLALVDLVTGRGGTILAAIGGLDPTDGQRDTSPRDALAFYARKAKGGEWIESSEYNNGTPVLWALGIEAIRQLTGTNHFPEYEDLFDQAGHGMVLNSAPNGVPYQWGDDEHPRQMWQPVAVTKAGVFSGLARDPEVRARLRSLANQMTGPAGGNGPVGFPIADSGQVADSPYPRFFLFYDPYAPVLDWRTAPRWHYNEGTGLLFFHTGYDDATDSFLGLHFSPDLGVDHGFRFFGDFQLYRKGEWVLTHPISYCGGPGSTCEGEGTNSMLIGGLSSMYAKGPVAQELGSGGEYAYLAGSTQGLFYWPEFYWMTPPRPGPFLHEWTRSILYLPSREKTSDTLVVYDRTKASPPIDVDDYFPSDAARITEDEAQGGPPPLEQWFLHSPVRPTETPGGFAWTTPSGQRVSVATLLPLVQNRLFVDELTLTDNWSPVSAFERKWQTRVHSNATWETFLNVIQAHDAGVAVSAVLAGSDQIGVAEGGLIRRAGHDDVLVMFGARPSGRILTSGYTIRWTAATRTEIYVLDLDPASTWTVSVGGGPSHALPVSPQGLGRLIVHGTGDQVLTLVATGIFTDGFESGDTSAWSGKSPP